MEALGFISLWGFTPAIDFLKGTTHSINDNEDLNVLVSECADIRHVLRTISDNLPTANGQPRQGTINIYLHEK